MTNRVVVDYYVGAYGPTLMVIVKSKEELLYIQEIFSALGNQKTAFNIEDLEKTELKGFKTIHLKQTPKKHSNGLRIVDNTSEGPVLLWELSALEWRECAELLESLDKYGHQYLTTEGVDDVLVEVSFRD